MSFLSRLQNRGFWLMLVALVVCTAVYWPGLAGGYLFDDYPNIVDNTNVHVTDAHIPSLVRAALSSPASEFRRPLASLTFAMNYLASGLAPLGWKLTNLLIHLLNGVLVYLLAKALLAANLARSGGATSERVPVVAALIAAGWMVLPINLTGVLYIVQRMESLANLFVLLGLLGYLAGRRRMLSGRRGLWLCVASLLVPTAIGLLAKETAVMLPLYAFLIEWIVFRFAEADGSIANGRKHRGLLALFAVLLLLPMLAGLAWLVPGLLRASAWATRDFTLGTRLLSEARIVTDYVGWTLVPTPQALSFYHDDFRVSTGLLRPWTTLASILFLAALATGIWTQRKRRPLVALGLALYLGCHLLTGTILPLELIYEHRNYFASFGLLLALVPPLAAPRAEDPMPASGNRATMRFDRALPFSLPRHVLLAGLMLLWITETALTSMAWADPLSLSQELAARAPASPRAQYELGRTYVIYSHYDPQSPFVERAYKALERAAALPNSSILPEQALIFMNARLHRPARDAWWDSLVAKLRASKPGVQDESSMGALTQCAVARYCSLPKDRMVEAFVAGLSHPGTSARLLAVYGDYAWNLLHDHELATRLTREAAQAKPDEPAYLITLVRMLVAQGQYPEARDVLTRLQGLNIGGRLDHDIQTLHALPGMS